MVSSTQETSPVCPDWMVELRGFELRCSFNDRFAEVSRTLMQQKWAKHEGFARSPPSAGASARFSPADTETPKPASVVMRTAQRLVSVYGSTCVRWSFLAICDGPVPINDWAASIHRPRIDNRPWSRADTVESLTCGQGRTYAIGEEV